MRFDVKRSSKRGGRTGQASGAGRDIEDAHTRSHLRGIEQGRDRAFCDPGERSL
jgi:hypothetical protein